jgi:hypothetical protein
MSAAEHVIAEAINPEAGYGNPDDLCWKYARTIAAALERSNLLRLPAASADPAHDKEPADGTTLA